MLIDTKWEASGNWSQDNIDNNTVTEYDTNYYQMYDYGSSTWVDTFYVDEWQSVNVEKIIQNANASLTILNIKIIGQVNIDALVTKEKDLWDQYDNQSITQKQYAEQLADAINANAKLAVIYVDSNQKIAGAEAYAYHYQDQYSDEWYPDMRFIFADGSKADAATYFGDGFGDFFDALNNFIAELNQEYDANIDPVDY